MHAAFDETGLKQRRLVELVYGAHTQKTSRRCVARLEFGQLGNNPRFVVTNTKPVERGDALQLYDLLCCLCGEAENRIKEAQLGLFALAPVASISMPTSFASCFRHWLTPWSSVYGHWRSKTHLRP